MKFYQIIFSFMEPVQAAGTFKADSEEEAINLLKNQLEGQVENLVIDKIEELTPEAAKATVPAGTFLN